MNTISKTVISVILGGGAGSRLYPLTDSRSKPAVPIAGKYRLVDIPISNCINSNINRMYVLTQYNSASLNKHIKNTYQFSAFSSGFVDILAAEQTPDNPTWFQGTADAVRQSVRHIEKNEFEYVLILSGDQLYQMDFTEMLASHIKSGADITIATIPVNESEATEFGILKADENNLITSFIEKPKKELLPDWTSDTGDDMKNTGRNYLASMGIYIFTRKLLFDLLETEHKTATDFGKEIIPDSITGQTLETSILFLKQTLRSHWIFRHSIYLTAIKLFTAVQECYLLQRSVAPLWKKQLLLKAVSFMHQGLKVP
jgi:glucose-1-phosphate adenylyltransferase